MKHDLNEMKDAIKTDTKGILDNLVGGGNSETNEDSNNIKVPRR